MLTQDLHDTSVGGDVVVDRQMAPDETAILHLEHTRQAVRICFVGTKQPEVGRVSREDIAQQLPELTSRLAPNNGGLRDLDCIRAKVGKVERLENASPVRMRIRSHSEISTRG